jgi:hypothetical protein
MLCWSPYLRNSSLTFCNFWRSASAAAFHVLDALEIPALDHVAEGVALSVLSNPLVDSLSELGILLAKGDGQIPAGAHSDVLCTVMSVNT